MVSPSAQTATPLQKGATLQFGPSCRGDDLYWQRFGHEERINDRNGWASQELAWLLEGIGLV
jgi:hypothetical protein